MKTLVLLSLCLAATTALPGAVVYEKGIAADECTTDVCTLANGCRCSSSDSPLASDQVVPQLISLTVDEAVTTDLYETYWRPLLVGRINPDGKPIGATFFVPHEYTDYESVNKLYNNGFEIGVNSITRNNLQDYWRGASEELLEQEFGGQKKILSKFANIPGDEIVGARTPQLQLAGNVTFDAYKDVGISYDSSWPTSSTLPLYPYTLNYKSTQICNLGYECPNESFDGFWILPINDFYGKSTDCNNLASCDIVGTADEISDWLLDEVNKVRQSTRVPLTLIIESQWFDTVTNSLRGFVKFLDKLAEYDDVFLVSQKQVLDWSRKPVPLSSFETAAVDRNAACTEYSCSYTLEDVGERYMTTCIPCPSAYPWLGNPDGNDE